LFADFETTLVGSTSIRFASEIRLLVSEVV